MSLWDTVWFTLDMMAVFAYSMKMMWTGVGNVYFALISRMHFWISREGATHILYTKITGGSVSFLSCVMSSFWYIYIC